MIQPFKRLDDMRAASIKGHKIRDCYTLMYQKELWIKAYCKLYANPGNMTKGTTGQTIDGFSLERIDKIIEKLKRKEFRFSPVRRAYIPKKKGGKRPLGVPANFDEKLTQEVMRMILENIYEPCFLDSAHGFRPNRSCHTALSQIKRRWKGLAWCVEGDIRGFFSEMNHQTLLELLKRKIDDDKFLRLIHNLLSCGYLENWKYHNTFSGTPQGSGLSPILSNVFLHELDKFVAELKQKFDKGKRRKEFPAYRKKVEKVKCLRDRTKTLDAKAGHKQWDGRDELIRQIKDTVKSYRNTPATDPMDMNYKRLQYVRYADDWALGIAGTKKDAEEIKTIISNFLKDRLNLTLSPEKTLITHLKDGIHFLSYKVEMQKSEKVLTVKQNDTVTKRRTVNRDILIKIPREAIDKFAAKRHYGDISNQKATKRTYLVNNSEIEILKTYNAELRGIANYYKIADNQQSLSILFHLATLSFLQTVATKQKSSLKATSSQMKDHQGRLSVRIGNKSHSLVRLSDIPRVKRGLTKSSSEVDLIPNTRKYSAITELERRLTANICEACGETKGPFEVHHIRRLKDLKKKKHLSYTDKIMIQRRRKTLILCRNCHLRHHHKKVQETP